MVWIYDAVVAIIVVFLGYEVFKTEGEENEFFPKNQK